MEKLSDWLTHAVQVAPPWLVYVVVLVVLFLETSTLICGLIVPSEAVLVSAGVAAAVGPSNVYALIAIGAAAAFTGDMTGYTFGRLSGPRITRSWAGRKFGEENWARAEQRVSRNTFVTVPMGRWIGYVRTLVPFAAGITHLDPARYAAATAIG
ncbi:MAG: DedA family protein, partial [Gordonia sp. (in: high G+C Gram-positive bacteria)]